MLILTRKIDQGIVIQAGGEVITVRLLGVERDRAKIGISAAPNITVLREELVGPAEPVQEVKERGKGRTGNR